MEHEPATDSGLGVGDVDLPLFGLAGRYQLSLSSLARSAARSRVCFVQITISALIRSMPARNALHCSISALVNTTASNSHQDVLMTECLSPSDRMESSSFKPMKYLAAAAAKVFTFFFFLLPPQSWRRALRGA